MPLKKLTIICLSFLATTTGCAGLPDQPDGWSCLLSVDQSNAEKSVFVCTRIRSPDEAQEFNIKDPLFKNAHCEDLETFRAYSDYVRSLRKELIDCRSGI